MSEENNENLDVTQVEAQEIQPEIDLSGEYQDDVQQVAEPSENQGQQVEVSAVDLVTMGAEFGTEYLAERKGEHWRMTGVEREKFGEIMGALAVKYGGERAVSPEVALIVFGVTFAAPRLIQDSMIQAEEEAAKASKNADQ